MKRIHWRIQAVLTCGALLVGVWLVPQVGGSEEIELSAGSSLQEMQLSLHDAIVTALEHNLDITVQRFNPLIRSADVTQALGDFDTTAFFSTTLRREESPPTVVFVVGAPQTPASVTESFDVALGVERKLSSGAVATVSIQNVQTVNPPASGIQNSVVGIELTQPLLRGCGQAVNLSDVRIARNSRRASVYDFQATVIDVIARVERAYWDLVFAHGDLGVRHRSLELAENLLSSNRERVNAGVLAPIEIIRAESSVASQEAAILAAANAVHDAEDVLRRLINSPEYDLAADLTVVPTNEPSSEYEPIDTKRAVYQALTHRPDLMSQKTDLESSGIELDVAENELLPTLDLTVFYRTKGAGRNFSSSYDQFSSFIFDDYGGTIDFSFPLENRAAKGTVTRARLELQQALYRLKNTEDAVIVDVRRQLRLVTTKFGQIERFRKARELASQRLDAENEKLILGTSTTLDVLEAQRELTTAERDEIRALTDFNVALVELRRAMGVLLQDYSVDFNEP